MNELEIISHPQIRGLTIFFDTVEYRTSHLHTEWEILWLLENPLSVTCRQKTFLLDPGQIVLFAPNEPHEFHKVKGGATFLCLQISAEILPQLPTIALELNTPHTCLTAEDMLEFRARLASIAGAYFKQAPYYDLYCVGQSVLLLHSLICRMPSRILTPEEASNIHRRNARLKRLIRFVDENYMHKIRLTDFAAAEGCSMSYLSRFIKDTMNLSFQDYVNSVRFNCACKLIAAGEKKLLDVCMESGYSDYRYFSRAFQQQYHMTPEEYSRYKSRTRLEPLAVHHSLHSTEQFYSREDSLKLAERYFT